MRTRFVPSTRKALIAPLVLLLLAVLGLTAVNSGAALGKTASRTWTVQVGWQTPSGSVQTMNFGSGTIWIDKGDTVRWKVFSKEIHTVSFINAAHPDAGYSPTIPYMNTRTPQKTISKPGQFRSSGIMTTEAPAAQRVYTLKFTGTGTFRYICYVHGGQMMHGTVVVRKAGTPYPHNQAWYTARTSVVDNGLIEHGLDLWDGAMGSATSHHVYIGAADMQAMVMRFIAPHVTVSVGDTVTFDMGKNVGLPIPHTVTFGPEPPAPIPVGNPAAWDGTGTLSSGVLLPPGFGPPGRSTYTVKFTKAGVYAYICMFHDTMGMIGSVTVQ